MEMINVSVSTPVNERKCIFCDKLEDEYHFVLECILYNDLRKQLIPTYYYRRPNMQRFVDLITTECKRVIRNLSTYIEKAFTIRTHELYRGNNS